MFTWELLVYLGACALTRHSCSDDTNGSGSWCKSALCCGAALVEDAYSAQKEVAKLRAELALAKSAALADSAATTASGARVVVSRLDGIESKALQV